MTNAMVGRTSQDLQTQMIPLPCALDSPKIRRSNSFTKRQRIHDKKGILKSKKDPIKKRLSFADSIEVICHFLKTESPSHIPFIDPLYIQDSGDTNVKSMSSVFLIPQYFKISRGISGYPPQQPFQVLLDQITCDDNLVRISLLVRNLAFEKRVSVRFTLDGWDTYTDLLGTFQATVGLSSGDIQGVDRFVCLLDLSQYPQQSCDLEFAVRYQVIGQEFWDNNQWENYKVTLQKTAYDRHEFPDRFPFLTNFALWEEKSEVVHF